METLRANTLPITIRAVLTIGGAWLLWTAPASIAGLVVMLVGLVFAVTGLTLTLDVVR